jgi:antitoxin (DNA-binding transcriptional repressor) of toxin-antitoxin stability system
LGLALAARLALFRLWSYTGHMETISVSKLKAQLSAELKRVQAGHVLTVVEHKHPIATISPLAGEGLFAREASLPYSFRELVPLMHDDPLAALDEERKDSW